MWIKWWRADRLHFPSYAKTNVKYAEDGKRLTGNRECYFISQSNRLAPFLFLFFLPEWHWHLCILSLLVHLAEFTGQCWASQVVQWLKNWSANAGNSGDVAQSLGWDGSLEKEMATRSSILAWIISWTEEPSRLQSMGSQRVAHDWATEHTYMHTVLYTIWCWATNWGCKEADTTEWLALSPFHFQCYNRWSW